MAGDGGLPQPHDALLRSPRADEAALDECREIAYHSFVAREDPEENSY